MKNVPRSSLEKIAAPFHGVTHVKPLFACLLLGASFLITDAARAQGIERESIAGESAAGAAHGSDIDQPYNILLGPVALTATAGFDTTFNDNINIAHTGRLTDVILTPSMDVSGVWQATDLNKLTFDVGIGYNYYTMHSGTSSLVISPDSSTQFNVYVGDFKINIHDDFAYLQDPLEVGQLSGISQFSRFRNVAGIYIDWDLGDVTLSLDYDHTNLWVFQSSFQYLTYQADSVTPKITFNLSKTLSVGLSAEFSDTRYDQDVMNNSTSLSVGPFLTAQINENLAFNAAVGYEFANYDTGGLSNDNSSLGSWYGSVGLNHRINDVLRETLTAGQEYLPGITSNYTQRVYANYGLTWQATDYLSVGTSLWWENLDDSDAAVRQTSNRYGVGLNLGYQLNTHASIDASYQYVLKDCDQSEFSYYQNQVTLGFRYQF